MQAHFLILSLLLGLLSVEAIHYKSSRPPPNLSFPQAKIHYGPKPPTSGFYKPPPFHVRRPIPIHPPRNPIRPPPRPHFVKPTPPTPPPFPPSSWKSHPNHYSNFHAPVVKETFLSSPISPINSVSSYTHDHFLDDDRGPIHTIPAPNLSPADRPHNFPHGSASSALEATLNHGQALLSQTHNTGGYQVTEDPSAYKPHEGPSYFAPDPDPSLPTVEVTKTIDPHSLPSNGVKPLDVYQQELTDQAQQQFYGDGGTNSLSSQELYSLMNGLNQQPLPLPQQQQVMTPELYQQYLQAAAALGQQSQQIPTTYQTVYNAGVLYHRQQQQNLQQQQEPQQFAQNFHPHFETFNYNEQTQEGAYGSDSFPSASSISVGVKRAAPKEISAESVNNIQSEFTSQNKYLDKNQSEDLIDEEVVSNQVDYEDEKSSEESESNKSNSLLNLGYYTTLPNKQTAETLATLAVAGNINNQMMKSPFADTEKTKEGNNEIKQQNNNDDRRQNSQNIYKADTNTNRDNDHEVGNQQTQINDQESENNDNVKHSPDDYNEDEILDPSDKDQMVNYHYQNGMQVYDSTYIRDKEEKENQKERNAGEQSYEDFESDYTQEDKENTNESVKSSNSEKISSFISNQNQLPFGAKLRPKRV